MRAGDFKREEPEGKIGESTERRRRRIERNRKSIHLEKVLHDGQGIQGQGGKGLNVDEKYL